MTQQNQLPLPGAEYEPEDTILPSAQDEKLHRSVYNALLQRYPERILPEHVRQAFEIICAECKDALPFKDFLRKVRLQWLWKRPPAPRGVVSLE